MARVQTCAMDQTVITIRRARRADAAEIAAVHDAAWRDATATIRLATGGRVLERRIAVTTSAAQPAAWQEVGVAFDPAAAPRDEPPPAPEPSVRALALPDLDDMSKDALREALLARGLGGEGSAKELRARLREALLAAPATTPAAAAAEDEEL